MKVLVILFFFLTLRGGSQTVHSPITTPYIGFGAYGNRNIDVFSISSNQASLAKINKPSAGVYGEKRFLLNELGLYNAKIVIPTSSGNFAFNASYFGFSEYNESQFGLAYARSLGTKVDVGVQFNYYAVRIASYGSASAVNFEFGAIFHLTDNLNGGLHVYNPIAGKLGKDKAEKLASIYSAGLGYEPSEKFLFSVEIQKEEDEPVNVNVGLQYQFLTQLLARAGVSSSASTLYMGIGFKLKSLRVDAIASYHLQFGVTPGVLLIASLSKKEAK